MYDNSIIKYFFRRLTFMVNWSSVTVSKLARHKWLMPIILVTWKAEIRRITVQGQPRQLVFETTSPK
jgi:hypothetical protein